VTAPAHATGTAAAGTTGAATAAAAGKATPKGPTSLSTDQAVARAKATRTKVPVTGATTPTDSLTANPDGTLTLDHALAPVRKMVQGSWQNLDPTLVLNKDGSVAPKLTTSALTLSGGGAGALATMGGAGRSLALTLPMSLPRPTLSGATATYASVLPGVDLQVTAEAQGGFSEVLVVHDAAAAANPALASLRLATRTSGVDLSADAAGNITAKDHTGHAAFTAPTPFMWDSAKATPKQAPVDSPITHTLVDAQSGMPVASSAASPGEGAHVKAMGTQVGSGAINLKADQGLLTDPGTVWPVYIDPTFTAPSAGSSLNSWTTVSDAYPTTSFWKTTGYLKVGYCGWADCVTAENRSFVNVSVPSVLYGSTLLSSQLNFTEEWSPSCTATPVQLWTTNSISSSTTWNAQPTWASNIGSQTVAHGYSSSCPAAGVGFDITSTMQNAVNQGWTNQTFGLRAGNETDSYGWKQFANTITLSTTYDHTPNTPTGLSTSPGGTCSGTAATVGDGAVSLYAPLSDPDGGTLGAAYSVTNTATGATIETSDPNSLQIGSGQTVALVVPKATLEAAAGGAVTEISWKVQATDYHFTGAWSAVCNFYFDPTRSSAPAITPPSSTTIGSAASFSVSAAAGTTPASYTYQLNGGAPGTATATSGNASFSITPRRFTNVLTVTGFSSGGNVGDTTTYVFNSAPGPVAGPADLDGDGNPDLLTVGGQNGVTAGVWLGNGHGNGQITAAATNVGVHGNGYAGDDAAADFNGSQVISGHFEGSSEQDLLAYYPTGTNAGGGTVLDGTGDGSPIIADANNHHWQAGSLADQNNDNPLQVANAGTASAQGFAYPDLITVSGDATSGYYLDYYANQNGLNNYQFPTTLTNTAPDGTMNWNSWTIATAQTSDGNTWMYLWNKSTGALYLWKNLAFNTGTGALSYATQYQISSSWKSGVAQTLQAADINKDGTPDLWAVSAGSQATAYLVTNLTGTPAITAQSAQTLINTKNPTTDFNGDGKDDIGILYNYLSSTTGFWDLTQSGVNNFANTETWQSSTGHWDWTKTKILTGDFNGDGKTDLALVYDYGTCDTGIEVFLSNGSGFGPQTEFWNGGANNYCWSNAQWVTGDFNGDGKTDIASIYNYGTSIGLWVFTSTGSGLTWNEPWSTAWSGSSSHLLAGDFNGDGLSDIAVAHDYGSCDTGIDVIQATGGGNFSALPEGYRSGSGSSFCFGNIKWTTGNYAGGSATQIAAVYNGGGAGTQLYTLSQAPNGYAITRTASPIWSNTGMTWANTIPTSGDFDGDGKADLAIMYGTSSNVYMYVYQGSAGLVSSPPTSWWTKTSSNWLFSSSAIAQN
jgi:hypothetical protein